MGIFSGISSAFDNWQENRTERVKARQERKAVGALTGQPTGIQSAATGLQSLISTGLSGVSGITDSILGNPKETSQAQGSNTGVLIAGAVGIIILIVVLYFALRKK